MDKDKIIQSLLKLLQKNNSEIINLNIQVDDLTDKLNAAMAVEKKEKDEEGFQDNTLLGEAELDPDIDDDEDFFKKFGEVFVRNAKFSATKPVPMFGFANTPIEEVNAFYKFWDGFKTWRTFNQYDEYDENDLESAEDRYEKRWMEK